MAFVGLETANFASTGNLETLGRSSIGLELGHFPPRMLSFAEIESIYVADSLMIVKIFIVQEFHQNRGDKARGIL